MLAVEAQQTAFAETESKVFCNLCTELDIRHIRLCPYTPRTNSKAERFIQIASQGMAYAAAYQTSTQRRNQLPAGFIAAIGTDLTGVSRAKHPSVDLS